MEKVLTISITFTCNIFSNWNLFTHKHLGVLMNSFKRVRALQIELEFENVDF